MNIKAIEIEKKYKIIAFDWDGTAVTDRYSDASKQVQVLSSLLDLGIYIIVITGTNVHNVHNQFSSFIRTQNNKNLYLCTNRGSEVFNFRQNLGIVQVYKKQATQEENNLLDKIAVKVKTQIEKSSNAKVNVIFNRLNRRKIDLITQWPDPKKSEIDKLILETNKYLENAGFSGGVSKAFDLAKVISRSSGLNDARITSDVKHIEVGLTDKSDSIRWMINNIARNNEISDKEILILGDEFGNIAGFEGSDYRMVVPDRPDITYLSVGVEPNGVPNPVVYIGGGPEMFVNLMREQERLYLNS